MAFVQLLAVLIIAIALGRPFVSSQDQIEKLTPNDLASGQKLFVAHCALCHGIGGTGGRGPSLNHPELRRAGENLALFQVIRNGIPSTEMPGAWQMTDRETWQVAGYVRSLGRISISRLPGDSMRGREVYEKESCSGCHIISGNGGNLGPDLTNIGAQRSAVYLREALLDPAADVPEGFLVVSVVGPDGKKVRGTRLNEDSFTIQLRDSSGVFHSFRKQDLTDLKKEFGTSLMPGLRNVLTAAETDDLVAYLASLRGQK